MSKMTKKQYQKQLAILESQLTDLDKQESAINQEFEAAEKPLAPKEYEVGGLVKRYHAVVDAIWEKKQEIEALEDSFRRRNWTSSDYASYDLVCQNID